MSQSSFYLVDPSSEQSLSINRPKSDGDRVRQSCNDGIAQDKEELDEEWIVVKK